MARGSTYRRQRRDGSWGRWHAVIDLPRYTSGSRRQVTRTFDTQREAHAWLARMCTDTGKPGEPEVTGDLTLSAWLTQWLDSAAVIKPSTKATARAHVEKYLAPALGYIALSDLLPAHVDGLVADLIGRELAPSTVARIVATLQSALSSAVRAGALQSNPVRGVRLPTIPARQPNVWTAEQARVFLSSCGGTGLDVLFRLALVTGMRRGELLGLTWPDWQREHGCLAVRTSRVAVGHTVETGTPKSGHGCRRVWLDDTTAGYLHRWEHSQARCLGITDGWVFTHVNGEPFAPWWVSRTFTKRITRLGLPRLRFHDLRHTSATLGLASGESLFEVSQRLGHFDVSITARIYGTVLPATAQASASRRAAAMSGPQLTIVQEVS